MRYFTGILLWFLFFALAQAQTTDLGHQLQEVDTLLAHHHLEEADSLAQVLQKQFPENPQVQARLGIVALSFYNVDKAIEFLKKATQRDPDPRSFFWLGNAYGLKMNAVSIWKKRSMAKAMVAAWEKAAQLDSQQVRYWMALYQYYFFAPGLVGGNKKRAEVIARYIRQKFPVYGEFLAAFPLAKAHKHKEAINHLQKLLSRYPNFQPAYFFLAQLYEKKQNYPQAIKVFRQLLTKRPENAEAWAALGEIYFRQSQYDSACMALQKAVKLHPYLPHALYRLGQCYEKTGLLHKAKLLYQRYLHYFPHHPRAKEVQKALHRLSRP